MEESLLIYFVAEVAFAFGFEFNDIVDFLFIGILSKLAEPACFWSLTAESCPIMECFLEEFSSSCDSSKEVLLGSFFGCFEPPFRLYIVLAFFSFLFLKVNCTVCFGFGAGSFAP